MLQDKCPQIKVINLASPGASNYLIALQVEYALSNCCDYLIYNATSSVRQELLLNNDNETQDSIIRYWNVCDPDPSKSLVCTTWTNLRRDTQETFKEHQYKEIENFFVKYIDLPSTIKKNYIFICHTLQQISKNKNLKNWAWSRGGFEHHSFKDSSIWDFSEWESKMCDTNLWDHYDNKSNRPFYHVTDVSIRKAVCDSYINMLQLCSEHS